MSADEPWSRPTAADDLTDVEAGAGDRGRSLTWRVGSVVLALLLVMRLVHHYRDRLVRQPGIGSCRARALRWVGRADRRRLGLERIRVAPMGRRQAISPRAGSMFARA